jgi:hypothetical protein
VAVAVTEDSSPQIRTPKNPLPRELLRASGILRHRKRTPAEVRYLHPVVYAEITDLLPALKGEGSP